MVRDNKDLTVAQAQLIIDENRSVNEQENPVVVNEVKNND
jgi:uncharacterized protein YfaP (DUF2135 family)